MPRKKRRPKERRALTAERLGFMDWFGLAFGFGAEWGEEIRSFADVKEAVRVNRDLFQPCQPKDSCGQPWCLAFHYQPGQRPWWWWWERCGLAMSPDEKESLRLLKELGELGEDEKAAYHAAKKPAAAVSGQD